MTKSITYTCSVCGDTCTSDWSDEEAATELKRKFGNVDLSECEVVCDDCYKLIVDLPPEIVQ